MRKTVKLENLLSGNIFYKGSYKYEVLGLNHWSIPSLFNQVMVARYTGSNSVTLFSRSEEVQIETKGVPIKDLKAGTKVKHDGVEYVVVEYATQNNCVKCLFNNFTAAAVSQDLEVEVI